MVRLIVTIDNSTAVNVGETDGGIDAKTGTQVLAWGATESGSLPTDFSKFWAKQQMVEPIFFPDWDSNVIIWGQTAKVSHVVKWCKETITYAGSSYIIHTVATPPGSGSTAWTLSTPKSILW